MSNRKDLKLSAYHEGGHLVIAWYYGRQIRCASIFQDEVNRGNIQIVRLFGNVPNLAVHELEREMDIIMAGIVATEQLTGKKVAHFEWSGTDYPDAVEIAMNWATKTGKTLNDEYLIDKKIDVDGIKGCIFSRAFLYEFGGNVRNLMSRPHIWECVEAIADALLKHKSLSGDEVTSILSKAWKEADSDGQEELFETQNPDNEERPWGEWR